MILASGAIRFALCRTIVGIIIPNPQSLILVESAYQIHRHSGRSHPPIHASRHLVRTAAVSGSHVQVRNSVLHVLCTCSPNYSNFKQLSDWWSDIGNNHPN